METEEKYDAAIRRIRLWMLLSGVRHFTPVAELAKRFECSKDTIKRDLLILERAGLATRQDYGDHAGALRVAPWSPASVQTTFSLHEVHVLTSMRALAAPFRGTLLHHAVETALDKLADTLGGKERAKLASACPIYFVPDAGALAYADSAMRAICDTMLVATMRELRVRFAYESVNGTRYEGTFAPYRLAVYRSTLYVLGHVVEAQEGDKGLPPVVRWPLHRFLSAELTRTSLEVPSDFRIEDHINGWGISSGDPETIEILFSARVAPFIKERRWYQSERVYEQPDGSLRYAVDVAPSPEFLAWILGYGADACVIGPATLRAQVRDHYRRALAALDDDDPEKS